MMRGMGVNYLRIECLECRASGQRCAAFAAELAALGA